MRNRMKLGREIYPVLRLGVDKLSDDGFWQKGVIENVKIRANIQGGLFWNSVKFSDSGDISKQAISIRSDEPLYMANESRRGDIILFGGNHWEVRDCRIYKNLKRTRHWEAMAVLVDGSKVPREGE